MLVVLAAVVVKMRRGEIARCGLNGIGHIAEQKRVADIHADAQIYPVQIVLDEVDQRRRG